MLSIKTSLLLTLIVATMGSGQHRDNLPRSEIGLEISLPDPSSPRTTGKPSALQFLKTKFPAQDEKTLSALYEVFKGGLYDARNIALSSLGETLRSVQDLEQRGQYASAVESIRRTLESLRETFGKITFAPR